MAKIACIGSRELSEHELSTCEKLGWWIARCGHELHSGNATGADQAYARGANQVNPELVHLHIPWYRYERAAICNGNIVWNLEEISVEWHEKYAKVAEKLHPAWHRLSQGARKLMIRNGFIVKPPPEFDFVDLVLAFPGRLKLGGTGQGMRLANDYGIKLVDLRDLGELELAQLCEDIREMK
jgi:hypothetical protein